MQDEAGWHGGRRRLVSLLIVLAAVVFLAVAVWVLPAYLAPRSAFDNDGDAVRAQNDARGMMLQGLGGLVLLLGAYVTWRQYQVNREGMQSNLRATAAQLEATQDQLVIAQEGQITERFTRAVDQLGSDQLVVRLGGIYGLERIAMNSPRDAATIAEVLSSYIRQRAPWPADDNRGEPHEGRDVPHLVTRAADVQAAVTVLARRSLRPEADERLRLLGVDLRRANLLKAQLAGADLEGTNLGRAWLRQARLDRADLTQANLQEADLADASLEGAELVGAFLRGANLEGASLVGADLTGADLDGAVADEATKWPQGFEPQRAGVTVNHSRNP
jgi:hypothetical protein